MLLVSPLQENYFLWSSCHLHILVIHCKKLLITFLCEIGCNRWSSVVAAVEGRRARKRSSRGLSRRSTLLETQRLLKKSPERIGYNILKAQIETDAKQYSAAIRTYKNLLNIYPGNSTINFYYAETLLKANKTKLAYEILQTPNSSPSTKTPEHYRLLSEAQAKLNKPADSHQSLAEYYYLLGLTHEAIKQLQISLNTPKIDFYLTSRLEARLKEFKNELHLLNPN